MIIIRNTPASFSSTESRISSKKAEIFPASGIKADNSSSIYGSISFQGFGRFSDFFKNKYQMAESLNKEFDSNWIVNSDEHHNAVLKYINRPDVLEISLLTPNECGACRAQSLYNRTLSVLINKYADLNPEFISKIITCQGDLSKTHCEKTCLFNILSEPDGNDSLEMLSEKFPDVLKKALFLKNDNGEMPIVSAIKSGNTEAIKIITSLFSDNLDELADMYCAKSNREWGLSNDYREPYYEKPGMYPLKKTKNPEVINCALEPFKNSPENLKRILSCSR